VFGQEVNAESSGKSGQKLLCNVVCVKGRQKDKFVVCQFNRSSFGYKYKNYWKL